LASFLYISHAVNNWDLVDTTTPQIVGDYLYQHQEKLPLWIKSCLSPNNNLAILNVGVNSPRLIKVQVATMAIRRSHKSGECRKLKTEHVQVVKNVLFDASVGKPDNDKQVAYSVYLQCV
jgi:hypothetical protein